MVSQSGDERVNISTVFLIWNFCHVLNVVFFLLGGSPTSEFQVPTFLNTLFRRRWCKLLTPPMKMEQSIQKCRHIKCRCWEITQKKEYNISVSCHIFLDWIYFNFSGICAVNVFAGSDHVSGQPKHMWFNWFVNTGCKASYHKSHPYFK